MPKEERKEFFIVQEEKPRKKIVIIVAAVVVLALAVAASVWALRSSNDEVPVAVNKQDDGKVVQNVVTGTGIIEAKEQFDITSSVTGTILAAPFEEGQLVHAGDLLYQIDEETASNAVEKSRLGLEKAQLAYAQTQDNINKLTVRANLTGTVTKLYVTEGDMVAANGKLAEVVNDEVMVLKVPFVEQAVSQIYPEQSATVTISNTSYTVEGTVKKVTSGHMVSADGSVVSVVEINVPNPGSLKKDDKGTAVVGGIACSDAGVFDTSGAGAVYAEVAGKVNRLPYSVGDKVQSGSVMAVLTNDTLTASQEQNSLAVRDASLTLQNQQQQLKDYSIASPITGTVIKKEKKQGETLDMMAKGALAVVADLSNIIFKMDVDELDISKVTQGQTVEVTTDAIPDTVFDGFVESISTAGKQISGVTLYEVTVSVPDSRGLMPGMNVNAKIHIAG